MRRIAKDSKWQRRWDRLDLIGTYLPLPQPLHRWYWGTDFRKPAGLAGFDAYVAEHNIASEDLPQAFADFLSGEYGWEGTFHEVEDD